MWVGLASGYVVAYGVRVVAGHSETEKRSSRKIEFFPTRKKKQLFCYIQPLVKTCVCRI